MFIITPLFGVYLIKINIFLSNSVDSIDILVKKTYNNSVMSVIVRAKQYYFFARKTDN